MGFAMAWTAAGHGATWAGLVLTAINLPRALFLLFGGAVADRVGAWRVMISADVAMTAVTLTLAALTRQMSDRPLLLVMVAFAIGFADAFYLPSSGSMPRLLVPTASLARATSARQIAGQSAAFTGPALGGLLLATFGLAVTAIANAATFAIMAAVLIALRPRPARLIHRPPAHAGVSAAAGSGSDDRRWPMSGWGRQTFDGLRVGFTNPVLRPHLLMTATAAGLLLPCAGLLVPVLARQLGWPPASAGAVAATIALGSGAVAAVVLVRGALPNPRRMASRGLFVASGGVAFLALVGLADRSTSFGPGQLPLPAALTAAALIGVGMGMFGTSVAPLVLGATPETHLARVQAVLVFAQSVPLLVTNNLLGAFADVVPAGFVLLTCAGLLAASVGVIGLHESGNGSRATVRGAVP
ncbi:hypothetical protein Aco04nite_71130 [Winogradskya consettensis]|uniref:Major facilitator superfamily (MFS) profile domain-containing protein n=2 Tax=Winogradskya consettensis TaxID=113560 RepID=A0A919VYL1_9ACTN|nr:hypothetical protein Aco04nite_71130 [Actinoplanes consettensis]